MNAHHGSKQDELTRKARQAFHEEERVNQNERRHIEEEQRHADMLTKTERLRELRLAREAAEQKAAAAKAKPVATPGVRPRKV
jgi:hypothetical protein